MYGFNLLTTVALFGLAHAGDKIEFGPSFLVMSTASTWIKEGKTTLILPETPSPQVERLAIWPGMETSNGNLIQAIAVSFENPAATLQDTQISGEMVPASPSDRINMHYIYNDSTGEYDQSAAINGEIVSTLSASSGQAQRWDVAVECQVDACTRRSPSHKYVDTTVILNEANPDWSQGLYTKWSTNSGLQSTDGGKTWTVSTIELNSHLYDESDIQYD
ncbi:unnamed protein product [Penicillium bialowiezense]